MTATAVQHFPQSNGAADLGAILARQREAFLRNGAPSLEARRADLAKLKQAIKENTVRIAEVISSDFGNRSTHESRFAEIWTTLAGIRHTTSHLGKWMKPKRVSVSLELMPGQARIIYQPVGVVGIISPWNYPFQLSILPLMAAIAAGDCVMLKPSELTPRTSAFLAELLSVSFPPIRSRWCKEGRRSAKRFPGCRSIISSIPARPPWAAM